MDYEKYRHLLAHRNLTREEEDDFMETVWGLIESGIDKTFRDHAKKLSDTNT